MEKEQIPSIGRIVHVADENGSQCAAIITCVHDDKHINVTRFNSHGGTVGVTNVKKVHSPPKGQADWNWPPRV